MLIGLGVVLHVKCKDCKEENKIKPYHSHRTGRGGPKTVTLNSRAALAMIHTGQGHSHLKADLSILGVGAMTSATFKAREREVGSAIESVCQESCARYRAKEKAESDMVDSNGDALISAAYDGAWQKRGKARDSITGFGTVIGESTGKVLDYGVRSTSCRKCEIAGESNAVSHNCGKNHSGSSKSMEPEIAVACFNNATNHGLKYSSYTGDEDTTTESHVKCRVNYETAKKTDKNHATRTLGSRLYSAQKTVKGLTSVIIKLFAYCILTKQGESDKIKHGLDSLVCHAFGDHCKCDVSWCGALKDPSNYKFKDLPGGKPLSGENLRAAIENAVKPFQTDEWCEKLANCGSSQANECVNGIVGTKAPKIRHYGSSESLNFRVASGVCQFNEGYGYLTQTTKALGLEESKVTSVFVSRQSKKRKREQERKKEPGVKRRRKELKKMKIRKKERLEGNEGSTYGTGIGVTEEGKTVTKGIIDGLQKSMSQPEIDEIWSNLDIESSSRESKTVEKDGVFSYFSVDLETKSLKRDSEIIQIACVSVADNHSSFSTYTIRCSLQQRIGLCNKSE